MQLVELHRNIYEHESDEVSIVAISYDPVATLAAFAEKHAITYPMLSDVGSATIKRLGLLNTQIESEVAYWGFQLAEKHSGLPYPGIFMLDEEGIVVDKVFERSHRVRPGGKLLMERLGVEGRAAADVVTAQGPGLAVAGWVDESEYFPNQLNRLTLRLAVDEDFHVYVPPNPDGFTSLTVTVGGPDGVLVGEHGLPAGHPFSVEGFSEEFVVADGEFEVVVPFYVLEDRSPVQLQVSVEFQACSATTCLPPAEISFSIDLTEIRA